MATGIGETILKHRPVFFTTCSCLTVIAVYLTLGNAFAFVTALILPIAFLWHFWNETWFSAETLVSDMTEKPHAKHEHEISLHKKSPQFSNANKSLNTSSSTNFDFDASGKLTRRTIHRPSPVAVQKRSQVDLMANEINNENSKRASAISKLSLLHDRITNNTHSYNSPTNLNPGFSYLSPSNRSLASPRDMSFRFVMIFEKKRKILIIIIMISSS